MDNYFQEILNEYKQSQTSDQVNAIRKRERISFSTSKGHPTQRPSTVATYLKFYKLLTPEEQKGEGLDYSAGLGKGSALLRQEFDANIESYEPFPHEDSEDITYVGLNSLPDKLYDYIFCSAVLNVVEQDIRNFIVQDIFAHLKPGGEAIIGVRSKADVLSARTAYVIDAENGEIIDRVRGSYQKGFTGPELREYISTILPEASVTRVEVSGFSQIVVRVARSEWDAYKDLTEAINNIDVQLKKLGLFRSRKYGIGKEIGGNIYVHKQYEYVFPQDELDKAKPLLPKDFEYQVVKYNPTTKVFSFIVSRDFDTNPEPSINGGITVNSNGFVKSFPEAGWIYHHKWMWVADDYTGFDVKESKLRSLEWTSLPNIDRTRIGQKKYWDANVVPLLKDK